MAARRGLGLTGLWVMLAALLAGAGSAAADSPLPRSPAPRIISPHQLSISHDGTVRVAVRVRDVRGTKFEASLDGASVTRRFGPRRQGVRRAKLTGLRPGEHTLGVRLAATGSARDADSLLADEAIFFVTGERRHDLLSVGHVRAARRPFRVRPANPFHQESGDRRAIRIVQATVNGRVARGVTGANEMVGRPEAFRISSSFGIRPGRSVVRIDAVRGDGTYDRRRRVIEMPRDRPIAGAGRDLDAAAGHSARLDGTDSRPAEAGARGLGYRWRVVSAPDGAKPRLRGRRSAQPRLKTSQPGRYKVALRVRQRVGGRVVGSSNEDVVTISAAASSTAAGLPFETMAFDAESGNLAVRVGDHLHDYPTYNDGSGPQVLGYTVMGFDSETLEKTYEFTPKYNNPGPCKPRALNCQVVARISTGQNQQEWLSVRHRNMGPSGLVNWIAAKAQVSGRPQIVVVVGTRLKDWITVNNNEYVRNLQVIGGPSGPLGIPLGTENTFSFVGVTNSPPDTGWWNTTNTSLEGSPTPGFSGFGNIAGNLAPGSAGLFTFVSQDAVPFDTNVTGTSDPTAGTTVTIDTAVDGENQYTGTCDGGRSGVLGLALDGGTAEIVYEDTFCFNGNPTNAGNLDELDRFEQFLQTTGAEPGRMIVVQSVGTTYVLGPDQFRWGEVAYQLEQYGGLETRDAFNRVDGGFTFVGGLGVEPQLYWSNQSGYGSTVDATRLKGLLVRGNNGILSAEQAQSVPEAPAGQQPNNPGFLVDYALQQEMYTPPVAWPGTVPQQAAIQWISKAVGFDKASDPIYGGAWTYDVRNYYDVSTYNLRATLGGLKPKFKCPAAARKLPTGFGPLSGTTFTPADCKWALTQLTRESDFVGAIWKLVGSLEKPLYQSATSTDLMFSVVAQTVSNAVTETDLQSLQASYNIQDFVGGGLDIVSTLFDIFGPEGSLIGPVLGLLSGAAFTADQFGTDSNGVPSLNQVSASIGQLASEVDQQFTDAVDDFETIGDVLVSDWGKLETVGDAVNTAQPAYTIPSDPQTLGAIQDLMIDGFKQEMIAAASSAITPYAWLLPQRNTYDQGGFTRHDAVTVSGNTVDFPCGDDVVDFPNLTTGMFWQAELFHRVETLTGLSPSYQVRMLVNFEPSDDIDPNDLIQLPSSLTGGLSNAPDGNVGTLNAGMTAASFTGEDSFQPIPPGQVDSGCGQPGG